MGVFKMCARGVFKMCVQYVCARCVQGVFNVDKAKSETVERVSLWNELKES